MNPKTRRYFLKDKEATQLLKQFSNRIKIDIKQLIGSKLNIELSETQTARIYSINNKPMLALIDGALSPSLLFEDALRLLPKIVVNMGAIPHICNGADVMAPGVVRIEKEFNTNDYVVIADERHNKTLAITIALVDSKTARNLKQGKIAKNIHYVGDKLWNQIKKV